MKEYVITLKNKNDLESFYNDMETPGGDLYIPDRIVHCCNRRPISRNTHYMLTEQEVELIKQDDRVLDISLSFTELKQQFGIDVEPVGYSQSSKYWYTGGFSNSNNKNWGLIPTFTGQGKPNNWDIFDELGPYATCDIESSFTGKNVDVVIVDGDLDKNHPEFAVNPDGTGGSRVVEYNWYSHNAEVFPGNPSSTYEYNPGTPSSFHGTQVACVACGNTQGIARESNIYNINPYGEKTYSLELLFDYIRAFHSNKPINPETGRKNPTIINCSFTTLFPAININTFTQVSWLGLTYNGPFTTIGDLTGFDVNQTTVNQTQVRFTVGNASLLADTKDLVQDGIVMCAAAGNFGWPMSYPTDTARHDYSYFLFNYLGALYIHYYYRGGFPAYPGVALCIGSYGPFQATSNLEQDKEVAIDTFTNVGPGIDVFAPGSSITTGTLSGDTGSVDLRNDQYKVTIKNGASYSSPHACGVLACVLERFPYFTQEDARQWLKDNSKTEFLLDYDTSPRRNLLPIFNSTLLRGATPRTLYFNPNDFKKITLNSKSTKGLFKNNKAVTDAPITASDVVVQDP